MIEVSRELAGLALAVSTALLVLLVLALYSRQRLAARGSQQLAERTAELEGRAAELRDLEERSRRRIAELEEDTAEARRRISEQERYTKLISHDLKIPLIAIHGFLGLLQQDALAGDAARLRKDVERIQGLVGKMAGLLDRLLGLSRIGHEVESPEEVPLAELAREAVEMVTSQIANRRIEVAIAPDLPVVWGDRRRLLEVLQNLIENAAKFMGPQPQPRLEIGWEARGEPVYTVRDNGIGIEERHHRQIFGLFERLDQAKEGHGIGLALVQRIVEAHGGRAWVESEGAGTGSTFCFTLAPKRVAEDDWDTKPGVEIREG
jgi:signal transduction histidine kinase